MLMKSRAKTIISIGRANVMADVTPSTVLIFILVVLFRIRTAPQRAAVCAK
jgi:hypothetical protein